MIWFDVAALVLLSAAFSTLQDARNTKLAESVTNDRLVPDAVPVADELMVFAEGRDSRAA